MPKQNEIIKKQFDGQARNFSNWSVTRNTEYQKAYFDFCGISSRDRLLDFACGTGEYAVFAAPKVTSVHGVDISRGMIEIAEKQAAMANLTNVTFLCHPVENTPFEDDSFSMIICRSAFHHFHDYDGIFHEMLRCCQKGGRISIQDIVAYPDDKIDTFFEEFEKAVDVSHHKTVSKTFLENLYVQKDIKITNSFSVEIELNVREYLGHAQQTEENKQKITRLLQKGVDDPDIAAHFTVKEEDLFFKREVFMLLGEK